MSWYNPVDWFQNMGTPWSDSGKLYQPGTPSEPGTIGVERQTGLGTPWQITDQGRKNLLSQQAAESGKFAGQAQQDFGLLGQQGQGALAGLAAQARGENSVSAEQLRQALGQNMAQQRSMAAGAAPANTAMVSRTAMNNIGRASSGLAGQQAVAGLQERNQAQQQYAQLLQGLRGQEMSASLGGRQNAISGYGTGSAGPPEAGFWQKYGGAISAGAGALSDRRAKMDVKDGEPDATKMLDALKAFTYRYKDEANGQGARTGVMAQDLERAGIGHAVIDTPAGKMVHGAHLATANTSMLVALRNRVAKLEGKAA